jgi:hypothetical protein
MQTQIPRIYTKRVHQLIQASEVCDDSCNSCHPVSQSKIPELWFPVPLEGLYENLLLV